jgi:hypothetical protein
VRSGAVSGETQSAFSYRPSARPGGMLMAEG